MKRCTVSKTNRSDHVVIGYEVNVEDIKLGERHRSDLGDIASLAESIIEVGLLHPIVVTPSRLLIAGRRRLEACKALGWSTVPVRTIDLENVVLGEAVEQFH